MRSIVDFFCLDNPYLLYNLILKNLKMRYRGSFLGMFWTILIPAFTSLVYFFIFKFVLKVGIPNYLPFIVAGLIPWTFFSQSLSSGLESLVANQNLLNKVPLPVNSLVFSELLTYIINLRLSLPILVLVLFFTGVGVSFYFVQYIFLTFLLFIMAYSMSLILSYLYVFFRDIKFLVSIIIQFWFYLTPIMYAENMMPENFQNLIYLNPIGSLFVGLHKSALEHQLLSPTIIATSVTWTVIFFILSYFVSIRIKDKIVESL